MFENICFRIKNQFLINSLHTQTVLKVYKIYKIYKTFFKRI